MQHEMMRHPNPPPGSDNVGDVLASIRRLIAQDEVGCRIPNQTLNTPPPADGPPEARIAPVLAGQSASPARITPLVLDSSTLVARDPVQSAEAGQLQGEIGNRLSRNLQQMIRHEIELALRQMCEQD